MQKNVLAFIREQNMLQPGDKVVVGVSGGADSVALLLVLWNLKAELGIELHVVHVHHGLRGAEADRDAAFVERLCKKLDIACRVEYVDVRSYAAQLGLSEEEAGRELRYRCFEKAADEWGGSRIAVAHHREDQAETILHNLFRGSGLKGLGGMAPVRGRIIRPLLKVPKEEILAYLQEQGQEYCLDSTNASSEYTRNQLRNQLIPHICRINAGALDHIVGAGERMAQADAYLEGEAERLWDLLGMKKQGEAGEPAACGIKAEDLLVQPQIMQTYLIRRMLREMSGTMKDLTAGHMEQIRTLAEKETGKQVDLPYQLTAWIQYGILWISPRPFDRSVDKRRSREGVPVQERAGLNAENLKMSRFPYEKTQEIPQNRYTKWFDYDKIKDTLSVRTRETGDFIMLADGRHKTVKAYMIDEKIPRQQRDKILLLAEGSHVLWIVGYRISEYYKVTEDTKHVLQVQAEGGEHGR